MTRIIRITECHQCPYFETSVTGEPFCMVEAGGKPTRPTGTPDWCPLEMLEEKTDA